LVPVKRNPLTGPQQDFIVKKLAAFEPPRSISAAFAAVFPGASCNENDILAIDPETTLVSPELHALFLQERERVLLDPKSAPFANQAARLIALSNQARAYLANNQPAEARTVFRQIAEEQGVIGGKAGSKAAAARAGEPVDSSITWKIVRPDGDV
jgi:hypothetical protein